MLNSVIKNYEILLISDYNKGLLTTSLLKNVFEICRSLDIKTIVDPKGGDFAKYRGVNVIKPNKREASAATGILITDNDTLLQACIRIKEITDCDDVVVTMSDEGIALFTEGVLTVIPTNVLEVVDVTGAGDTVLASIGISLLSGKNLHEACYFANHAAAVVVSKVGSATASLDEINQKFSS